MYKSILVLIFLAMATYLQSQNNSISENNISNEFDCIETFAGQEIFKIVEHSPIIKSIDSEELENTIEGIVKKLRIGKSHKSILTLKIFFPIDGNPCIHNIESEGDILSDSDISELIIPFKSIIDFEVGRQRKKAVCCESLFDIIIKKGKLRDLQYSNVRFEN